jgi:hypothetical protein
MWLGGLFTPEAYLTATRQCAAQSLHVSLEELIMRVQMLDQPSQANSNKENTFFVTGSVLFIIGFHKKFDFVLKFRFEIARCFMS